MSASGATDAGFPGYRQFSPPARVWLLAAIMVALQVVFCGALFCINLVAEDVPGRRVDAVLVASAEIADIAAVNDADFTPTRLVGDRCCDRSGAIVRTRLDTRDTHLHDPAILIVNLHDNAMVYLDGRSIGGQGVMGRAPSILAGRPIIVRLPKAAVVEGADLSIAVQRAIGVAHLRAFYIGEYDSLYRSFIALRVLRADLLILNAAFGVFLAAVCFCAAPLFGRRGLLASLGALAASWALQHVGNLVSDPPWGSVVSGGIYYCAFLATLLSALVFFVEWTSVFDARPPAPQRRGWARLLGPLIDPWSAPARRKFALASIAATLIAAALISWRLSFDLEGAARAINAPISWFGLLAMPLCLVRILAFYARTGSANPIEGSAFAFVIVAAIADLATVRFLHGTGIFLAAAVTFFPIALLVSLALRARGVFDAATATAERLNVLVEQRGEQIRAGLEALQARERASMLLEERARITRDMHDGIGGQLLGLIVQARSNRLSPASLLSGLEDSLADLRLVVESLDQGENSLANALGAFRTQIEPRCDAAGVALIWRIGDVGAAPELGPSKILQIYRILQEACTNALQHGRPNHIIVELRHAESGRVEISLQDDGGGFEPSHVAPGRGLVNMRKRAQNIGALLQIESAPTGTRLVLSFDPPSQR